MLQGCAVTSAPRLAPYRFSDKCTNESVLKISYFQSLHHIFARASSVTQTLQNNVSYCLVMLFKKDWRPMATKGQLAGVHPETNVAGHWLVRHKDVLTFQRVAM